MAKYKKVRSKNVNILAFDRNSNSYSPNIKEAVKEFFERDDTSKTRPGKKDFRKGTA